MKELVVSTWHAKDSLSVGRVMIVDDDGNTSKFGTLFSETELWLQLVLLMALGARNAGIQFTHTEDRE